METIKKTKRNIRLDINYSKKSVKKYNTWRLKNTLLNNQEITEEIKKEIKKYLETNDNQTRRSKTYRMQQKKFYEGSLQQYNPTLRNKKHHI